jgi:hypothetical protein
MTNKKIEKLTNQEIDELVAEKVMGWKRVNEKPNWWNNPIYDSPEYYWIKPDGTKTCYPANYSSDISEAWEVVEKFFILELSKMSNECSVSLYGEVYTNKGHSVANTAPIAICLAALEAVGYDIPESKAVWEL